LLKSSFTDRSPEVALWSANRSGHITGYPETELPPKSPLRHKHFADNYSLAGGLNLGDVSKPK
jgi:hypothetical protein